MTDVNEMVGQRHRSPAFPVVPLETALERLAEFEEHYKRSGARPEKVGEAWSIKNKAYADRIAAAPRYFGLLEYQGSAKDRSIVISGDTSPTEETIKACNGCDVLIHEVRTLELVSKLPGERRSFGAKNHTTSEQLAALAAKAKPSLLIAYHAWIAWGPSVLPSGEQPIMLTTGEFHSAPDILQKEIASRYSGHFVIGRDLDVY